MDLGFLLSGSKSLKNSIKSIHCKCLFDFAVDLWSAADIE